MILKRRFFSLTKREEAKFKKWRKQVEEKEKLEEKKEYDFKLANDTKNLGKLTVAAAPALYGLGMAGDHLSERALSKYKNLTEDQLIKLRRAIPAERTRALKRVGMGAVAVGSVLYGAGKLRKRHLDKKYKEGEHDSKA